MTKKIVVIVLGVAVFAGGFVAGAVVRAQSDSKRVFELRTYTAPEGKLGELHKRSASTRAGRRPKRTGPTSRRIRNGRR